MTLIEACKILTRERGNWYHGRTVDQVAENAANAVIKAASDADLQAAACSTDEAVSRYTGAEIASRAADARNKAWVHTPDYSPQRKYFVDTRLGKL